MIHMCTSQARIEANYWQSQVEMNRFKSDFKCMSVRFHVVMLACGCQNVSTDKVTGECLATVSNLQSPLCVPYTFCNIPYYSPELFAGLHQSVSVLCTRIAPSLTVRPVTPGQY